MESNAIKTRRDPTDTECPQEQTKAFPFSAIGELICYWAAAAFLSVATAYLIHSQFTHPGNCLQPANDPLGIVTPPWLLLPLPPLGAVGSLAQVFWQGVRGRRNWKWLLAAVAFAGTIPCGDVLGTCA